MYPPTAIDGIPPPDLDGCRPKRSKLKVLIIGVDALSPDGIRKASTPNLDRLMSEGAYSLQARAVFPTVSAPNWMSILSGAGPEQHGVRSNSWTLQTRSVKPSAVGLGPRFPSVFDLLAMQRPKEVSLAVHNWDVMATLFNPEAIAEHHFVKSDKDVLNRAVERLVELQPRLSFVYFSDVDHVGHQKGHGSSDYYRAVKAADRKIGTLLQTIEGLDEAEDFVVIVVADHGGLGKQHAGGSMVELLVPWIIWGAEVESGRALATPINSYDTAATAADLLGLCIPTAWEGQSVTEAFGE